MKKLIMAGKDVARIINNTIAKAQSFHPPKAPKPFKTVCWNCGEVLRTEKQIKRGFCNRTCEKICEDACNRIAEEQGERV